MEFVVVDWAEDEFAVVDADFLVACWVGKEGA